MSTEEKASSNPGRDNVSERVDPRPGNPPTGRSNFSERVDERAEKMKRSQSDVLQSSREALDKGSRHAESALHHATDATAAAARDADKRAAELGERGQEQWTKSRDWAESSFDDALGYVRANPGKSMAIAVAGGWLLGSILRRRR